MKPTPLTTCMAALGMRGLAVRRLMKESVMKFRQELSDSVELQEKLKSNASMEGFIALAKENGHEFTAEECESAFEELQDSDEGLTEFELDTVSGGWFSWCPWCG